MIDCSSEQNLFMSQSDLHHHHLQVDERKTSLPSSSQAAPAGMTEVSEEEELRAAEEVNLLHSSRF